MRHAWCRLPAPSGMSHTCQFQTHAPQQTTPLFDPLVARQTVSARSGRATDGCCDGWGVFTIRCSGNIRTRRRVWLSKAPTRSANCTETLDDQIYITWRGGNSVNGDWNSLNRRNRSPGAGRIRLFPSGRKFRNCIHTSSATRKHCRRPGNSGRNGISTIHPFTKETRNFDQTLVGTGRPPSAARRRCSRIHVSAGP
jgi:hypothetical protein